MKKTEQQIQETHLVKTETSVSFSGAGLPSPEALRVSMQNTANETRSLGMPIIKLDRTGAWCFGAEAEEVEKDSRWAVNPYSFMHGVIAWGDGEVLAEHMVSVSEPMPDFGNPPEDSPKGWQKQYAFFMRCVSGEDEGMDVRYNTLSVGGKRAVAELSGAIAAQVDKDPSRFVPVVVLRAESYKHRSYGRIFTPVFDIVEWVSVEPSDHTTEKQAPEAKEVSARARRKDKPVASTPPVEEVPEYIEFGPFGEDIDVPYTIAEDDAPEAEPIRRRRRQA